MSAVCYTMRMANSQLTAYASAQLDKGVSREAITQALVGAGWMQADVDAAITEVMQQRGGTMNVSVTPGISPTVTVSQTQPAATPDLSPVTTTVTASASPVTVASVSPTASVSPAASVNASSFFASTPSMTMDTATVAPRRSLTWLFVLVGIILALGIIGGGAYAFLGSGNVVTPTADPNELATAQQERDQLRAEVETLNKSKMALEKELSFFAATTTNPVTHDVAGKLSTTTTNAWIVTTPNGIVVTVANAKSANVAAALAPLKDADVTVTGTHAPGSTLLTVTAVNGIAIQAASATTTTTTSTVPGTR